jgi:dihydroorotase/N-acyl-D-amino-acid deacylase
MRSPGGLTMRAVRETLFLAILLTLACGTGGPAADPSATTPPPRDGYDLVIEGGRIIDGTGSAWYYGDVAIQEDRIARIAPPGLLRGTAARDRIDASGLVVAPGFIDIQSHSRDAFLEGDGRVISKVTQGITTEIMGESVTNAPANVNTLEAAGITGPTADSVLERFGGPHGFDGWLTAMVERGVSPNIGSFLGAATVRIHAMGTAMGDAGPTELNLMRTVTRQAMEDGAFGVGSALIYPPGNFASTDELSAIASAMAPYGGVYITHMRSEGDNFLEAIDEALEIGRRGGVPVEIYHLKAAGQRNWEKAGQAIAKIDSARAAGIDVQANMYPYVAGGTRLSACFPPWASADGKLLENLRDEGMREAIRESIEADAGDWENLCLLATPEGVMPLGFEREGNKGLTGRRLGDIAEMMGTDWIDAVMELVRSEDGRVGAVYFLMSEENLALQMQQPWIKFGTDAGGFDPDEAEGLTHPRAYGTFPRILGKYVRDGGVMTLEDAVRKMTSAVATRLSIQGRGLVKEGMYADLAIFDPATVADRATFEEPHQLSTGIEHVLVNGAPVVRNGIHTGATPGRVVRGPGYAGTGPR